MAEVVFDNVPDEVLNAVIEFWHFKEGDHVEEGEDLVDLKSNDGSSLTITAPVTGVLTTRFYREEDEVEIGEVLAEIDEDTDVLEEDLELDEFEDEDMEGEEEEVEKEEMEEMDEEDNEY